ncbi:MAG TPA: hypothetical protein VK808_09170 [Bacteroidia bacterium]|jgi:hypothetical protein|nr:hypothetical protein [Bacteroidia bacterium]
MKKLFLLLPVIAITCFGCGKVDQSKAKTLVETLIHTIDNGDYAGTNKFYTDEFNASESIEVRTQKYKDLKDAFGNVTSLECVSVKDSTDPDDRPIVMLMYKVKHTKLTSMEAYSVVSQNGDYKIEQQDIRQEKL